MDLLPRMRGKNTAAAAAKDRTVELPLFCPKCKRESIINARNYQIETIPPSARR